MAGMLSSGVSFVTTELPSVIEAGAPVPEGIDKVGIVTPIFFNGDILVLKVLNDVSSTFWALAALI